MKRSRRIVLFIFIILVLIPEISRTSSSAPPKISLSIQKEIEHSIVRGLKWLASKQEKDGSWRHYPAITALTLSSFLRAHPGISLEDSIISAGFNFLNQNIHDNGGIYLDDMQNYNTSISLMAFEDARSIKFASIIKKAKQFLISMQNDESKGFTPENMYYGGISYGGEDKPSDLSNLQWALEAMQIESIEKSGGTTQLNEDKEFKGEQKLFWDRAIKFLERCQNLKKTNDQSYSGNDGGFMYGPGTSKAGETRSYGSMTYAGLKSFIYADLTKFDSRVQAAFKWISEHFILKENPGMEKQGLFYYYHTMAKALNAYGEEIIVDQQGKKHYWRKELAGQLLKIQHSDGYWVNDNARWWENDSVLVTAYTILALEEISGLPETWSRKSGLEFRK